MTRRWVSGVVLGVLLAAAGCSGPGVAPSPASSASVPPPTTAATASGATTTAPAPDPTVPTPAAPAVPNAAGAIDVSSTVADAGYASFASPSGKIWCAFYDTGASCNFPPDYAATIPSTDQVCPDDPLNVTGVEVTSAGAAYFCSGDSGSNPVLNTDDPTSTAWWTKTGWASVKVKGQKLAILPYGKSLVAGDFVCASAKTGVTCGSLTTGKGFRMARAGVAFIG